MKLIIAGSRTFIDYQLLCQTLAPEWRDPLEERLRQEDTGQP